MLNLHQTSKAEEAYNLAQQAFVGSQIGTEQNEKALKAMQATADILAEINKQNDQLSIKKHEFRVREIEIEHEDRKAKFECIKQVSALSFTGMIITVASKLERTGRMFSPTAGQFVMKLINYIPK